MTNSNSIETNRDNLRAEKERNQARKAIFISGPVRSIGRSGLSWGLNEKSDWDTVIWDSTEDIVFNVQAATSLGYKCFYFHWANDEIAKGLNIPDLELIPILDPFLNKDSESTAENLPKLIKELGPLAKNFTHNDQRQAFASQFGFSFLLKLGFEISLRIRSDQRMNWVELSADLLSAYDIKRMLFPAQRSFTSLDAGYTGFSVLDFFYGGDTRILSEWFSDVLIGGRLYGPHQDIAWKPLINSATWKKSFPGLSILSDINNMEKQLSMAQVFWQEFAIPTSKKTMNQIVWRGNKLVTIDYKVSREELFFKEIELIDPCIENMVVNSNLLWNLEWDLVTSYLMGGTATDPLRDSTRNDIMLNHLRYVLNSGHNKKKTLYLQILKLLLFSKFSVIREIASYRKKLKTKLSTYKKLHYPK